MSVSFDLSAAACRAPLTELAEAYSGARLERVALADGRRLVCKHLAPEGDWLTRATDGLGRLRAMWESGVFGRIGRFLDHTILDVPAIGGHDVVVMRDASDDLVPAGLPVSRATSRSLLRGLASMHRGRRDATLERPCPIGARYAMFAPAVHRHDTGPGPHALAAGIARGWEIFADNVDADVAAPSRRWGSGSPRRRSRRRSRPKRPRNSIGGSAGRVPPSTAPAGPRPDRPVRALGRTPTRGRCPRGSPRTPGPGVDSPPRR